MSVANQANEKLTQLVTLTAKIESYLNPNNKKRGEAQTEEGKSTTPKTGPDILKEAAAISGLATSLTSLIKEVDGVSPDAGEKLKTFLISMSDGLKEASKKLNEEDAHKVIASLDIIVKGAAKLAVAMILIGIASPLVALGTIVFTMMVSGMVAVFSKLQSLSKNVQNTLDTIMSMGKGALLFALTMAGIGLIAPLFALGVIVFTLGIGGMILVLSKLTAVKKGVTDSMTALFSLAKGAAIFALTMVGIALVAPLFAIGVLVFTLAVAGMLLVLGKVQALSKGKQDSVSFLLRLAKGAAIFALVMVGIGLVAKYFAIGVITFALGVGAVVLSLVMMSKFVREINRSLITLRTMIVPIALLAGVLFLVGLGATQVALGALVTAGSIIVLGLSTYLIGKIAKQIQKGVGVLYELGPALLIFSAAMFVLAAAPGDPLSLALKMAVIAGSIVVLGFAAYALGLPAVAPFALLGAGVLIALGAALAVFSGALFILSKANFTKEQGDALGHTIKEIGFSLAKIGLLSPLIMLGSLAIVPASLALLPLSFSLERFKKIGWSQSDSDSLSSALVGVVRAFTTALQDVSVFDLVKMMAAVPILGMMGTAISSLAQGVKSMATLTFTESEYDEKTGKLVPKREVRLTDQDIRAVGPNVASILNALTVPLTTFGMWSTMGEVGFGPFTIGAGYMEKGLDMASKVGRAILSIAEGVQSMANLEVVEYEVIGKGTSNAKLVPKSSRKLTQADFTNASQNVTRILQGLAKPLVDFGKMVEDGEGWFSDGYLEKGVDAASKVGGILINLSKGVADMASLEVTEYQIVGKGTSNAKLVPKSTRKLTETDFQMAAVNVNKILQGLAKPLLDFGKAVDEGSGWFSDGYLEKGIEGIAMIADPIAKLAKSIVDMSAGQATINEVIDGKIVPKSQINFSDAVPIATENLKKLLGALPPTLVEFGKYVEQNYDVFNKGKDGISIMTSMSSDMAKLAENYVKSLEALDKTASLKTQSISPFLTDLSTGASFIGKTFQKDFTQASVSNYDSMVNSTSKLASIVTPFEKFVKAFGKFSVDMGVFTKNFEVFGKDNASNFKTMGDVVDKISKVDVGKLKAALTTLSQYAKEEESIARIRAQREKDQASTGAGGGTQGGIQAASGALDRTAQAAASRAPVAQPPREIKFPDRIENLTVTFMKVIEREE